MEIMEMIANMMEERRFSRSDVAVQREDDDVGSGHGGAEKTRKRAEWCMPFFRGAFVSIF
jgi:hypothetical protein